MQHGFDILIISTRNSSQEEFWHKKLRASKGEICRDDALIITVAENWPGGAGTGLGTLYAYQKAVEKGKFKYHRDIAHMLRTGASIALYHTAGYGKELFPLLASEENAIANLKIPSTHGSLLELVVKQTNEQFSTGREGRLSVFHCDQVFYPDRTFAYSPDSHLDLFCQTLPQNRPGKSLVVMEPSGAKVFDTSEPVQLSTRFPIATNLSGFSLSWDMTQALMEEFKGELEDQNARMNANTDFWMPLTVDYETYLSMNPYPEHQMHYHRMAALKSRIVKQNPSRPFIKAMDIGRNGYWWDFRSVKSYYLTLLKLTRETQEGHHMKQLFGIKSPIDHNQASRVIVDRNSCLIDSEVHGGSIKNSVLIGVKAESLILENCVVIHSNLNSLETSNSLIYSVDDEHPLKLAQGTVRADITLKSSGKKYQMYSHLDRDGVSDWNTPLPQNPCSYSEIHQLVDQSKI